MTIHRNINVSGLGGNYTTWTLIKTLLAAGWTCQGSSSGTGGIYSATQNVFSPSINPVVGSSVTDIGIGVGSEHWGNANCWICLRDPGARHEYVIKRHSSYGTSSDHGWAIGYSPGALFTGGGLTTPPTATDQQTPSTLSAYPTVTNNLHVAGGTANLVHCAADDTPSDAGEYGWILIELQATNSVKTVAMHDDVFNLGTNPHANVVVYKVTGLSESALESAPPYTFGKTYSFEGTWDDVTGRSIDSLFPSSGGIDPYDSKERGFVIPWKNNTRNRYAGMSRWLRWSGVNHNYPAISDDLLHVIFGQVTAANLFDGVSTPLAI